ncbi:hypothetical protein [Dyadobacter sp. CY323]|uniref:hypothetical protein n=1 Tax=Dyadobacter sp. CY323 TaxID=2907302 RepID=UPI001F347E1A|nr:hypothetical protein [Dyadobacter sp. CY323]MCE6991748.1 hypothetical protein [Dyadobacter sp. CY323]
MRNHIFSQVKTAVIFTIFSLLSLATFAQDDSTARIHIGFVYPISSNGQKAASYTNQFSFHAVAGLSKAETGFTLSGVSSLIKENAKGAQITGAANIIGGSASGTQIAGAINVIGNNASGAQVAGFANIIKNEAKGAQIAGFMNLTGAVNSGQVAGFTNIATKHGNGFQLAGFLNKAQNVNSQISGFANVAKKVKGVQLAGFINIADSSDYPIALFNFIKNGEKSISLSVDETVTTMASFRSGGRVLYGIAGVGYNLKDNDEPLYGVEAGLGAHIPVADPFRINLEAVSQTLTDFKGGSYFKNSLRILPAYKIGQRFEVFAGPTFNYISYEREDSYDFIKKFIWKNTGTKDFQGVYVGFNAGLQIIL